MNVASAPPRAPLVWTDWPARQQPLRSGLAASIIVLTVAALIPWQPWLAALALFILLSATAEVLLPARYTVDFSDADTSGATVQRLWKRQTLSWAQVSGVDVRSDRLVLTARAAHPWLARRRSLTLRAAPPSLLTLVKARLDATQ